MNCPSILYSGKRPEAALDKHVFEDIKLNAFLTDEAIEAVAPVCSREDVLARRALFIVLGSSPELRGRLSRLYDCIMRIRGLDELYRTARSDEERSVIYISIARETSSFVSKAVSLCEGMEERPLLLKNFSDAFAATATSPGFIAMTGALETVLPILERFRAVGTRILGEQLTLTEASGENYVSRIADCAARLGLSVADALRQANSGISGAVDGATRLSAEIIAGIARKNPSVFGQFAEFHKIHGDIYDRALLTYAGEIAFYTGFTEMFDRVSAAGIPLTYCDLCDEPRIDAKEVYDITLLTKDEKKIVPNDALFTPEDPFWYLTGANGGGKTTYLRAVGIAVVMNMLGAPTACSSGTMFLPDRVFTHFPRDDRFEKSGRFLDEHRRVEKILADKTNRSVVLLNETYSGTDEDTAQRMTGLLAEKLHASCTIGIYITHQHGLSETEIPYLNVVVDREDNNRRTYKVEQRRGTFGSFAHDILLRYSLTREQLRERFGDNR
ncbi:MAG: hypothetical protein GX628_07555 [Clostridiales bacterium]|nr:hypothetical protein [Clostridiales bacterium]